MTMATLQRIALAGLLLVIPALLTHCGNADGGGQVASVSVGPAGPTVPSGYYFKISATPHTITSGSNIVLHVQVWDSSGNLASGVTVVFAGDAGDPKTAFIVTGADGQGGYIYQHKGPAGSYVYLSVVVEDKQLTIPVWVMPGTVGA